MLSGWSPGMVEIIGAESWQVDREKLSGCKLVCFVLACVDEFPTGGDSQKNMRKKWVIHESS